MHRFFPTFLTGSSAVGLLLLRLALTAGILTRDPVPHIIEGSVTLLLLLGLGTPVCGISVALFELQQITSSLDAARVSALLATMAIALVLLGPGIWSIDARLFGFRHISIPPRRK